MMTDESSSSYSLAYECEQNQTVISVNKVLISLIISENLILRDLPFLVISLLSWAGIYIHNSYYYD